MRILVTGANGQLGNELRIVLAGAISDEVFYTDRAELDLTDAKAVENFVVNNDITHIVNCAAYTNVDLAETEKLECASVNVNAVKNIAMAADANGAKVIHISTDYVFDGTAHKPYRESDKVNPISQYGTTKRTGETALIALAPESIIIRTAWLYSPFGKNFVKTMLRLSEEQKEISVVSDQIGTPTYAHDLAVAILAILRCHQWVSGIYHFTDEGVCSWYDFAKSIIKLSGHSCKVKPIASEDYPRPAARPYYSVLDKSRIKATYGVEIPHWEDSLEDCLKRIKELQKIQ